jgi:hypothetical protein
MESDVAESRCLRVVSAWRRSHAAEPTLEKLGLPREAITDPYIGEPLKVVEKPEGWLIYTVGPNLTDDGGAISPPLFQDVGLGPEPMAVKKAK